MSAPPFRNLPIRTREVFAGDGEREKARSVHCSHRHGSISVDDCKACPFARSVDEHAVVCARALSATDNAALVVDPHADTAEAAARITLREIVGPQVTCIRPDATVAQATSLILDRGLRCLPVVDADGRLVGIVSKTDLVNDRIDATETTTHTRLGSGFHLEPIPRLVSEIMTSCVHALPEDAPLSFAISLFAFESLNEVPVVASDGRVIGVATAVDVLRWLARRMGYVIPEPSTGAAAASTPKI